MKVRRLAFLLAIVGIVNVDAGLRRGLATKSRKRKQRNFEKIQRKKQEQAKETKQTLDTDHVVSKSAPLHSTTALGGLTNTEARLEETERRALQPSSEEDGDDEESDNVFIVSANPPLHSAPTLPPITNEGRAPGLPDNVDGRSETDENPITNNQTNQKESEEDAKEKKRLKKLKKQLRKEKKRKKKQIRKEQRQSLRAQQDEGPPTRINDGASISNSLPGMQFPTLSNGILIPTPSPLVGVNGLGPTFPTGTSGVAPSIPTPGDPIIFPTDEAFVNNKSPPAPVVASPFSLEVAVASPQTSQDIAPAKTPTADATPETHFLPVPAPAPGDPAAFPTEHEFIFNKSPPVPQSSFVRPPTPP